MTPEPITLDPEVEAILREVAADPDSGLLRVPRKEIVRSLHESTASIGPASTGLTSLERELVLAHRHEVAHVLRQACWLRLAEDPDSSLIVSKRPYGSSEIPVPREERLRDDAADAKRELVGSEEVVGVVDILDRLLADPRERWPHVADLAAAAHRLEPTDQSRLYAAFDLGIRMQPRSSLQLCGVVVSGTPRTDHAAAAWEAMGRVHGMLGRPDRALDAYQMACRTDVSRGLPVMNCLVFALQCGRSAEVIKAADRLDELLQPNDPAVEFEVHSLISQRHRGSWRPTAEGIALAAALGEKLAPVGRKIAHAFS